MYGSLFITIVDLSYPQYHMSRNYQNYFHRIIAIDIAQENFLFSHNSFIIQIFSRIKQGLINLSEIEPGIEPYVHVVNSTRLYLFYRTLFA